MTKQRPGGPTVEGKTTLHEGSREGLHAWGTQIRPVWPEGRGEGGSWHRRGLENSEASGPCRVFVARLQKGIPNLTEYVSCLTCLTFSSLPSFLLSWLFFFSSSFLSCSFLPNLFPSSLPLPCPLYFFTHRKIKTNYFIVSLAFADLLVSVLVMPFGAIELVQDIWVYGEMFCLVRTSLDVLLTTASIFHLCCISLDR